MPDLVSLTLCGVWLLQMPSAVGIETRATEMYESKGRFTKHKDAGEASGPTPSTEAKGRQTTRRWRVCWEEKKKDSGKVMEEE